MKLIPVSISIGLVFGTLWLIPYWPPLFKRPGLLAVGIAGAFLTWASIAFIQIPLQTLTGQALARFWDNFTLLRWLLLAGIPQILLSGLVQEAAKLAPVVFYSWRNHWNFSPKFGLMAGALSGAGFGIFEAIWVFNTLFASGWNWNTVEAEGFLALLGFWERFFCIAFHIAASALVGYGLARHRVWQYYLVASFLHGALNYSAILLQKGLLTTFQLEICIAVLAVAVTAVALWLRWRKELSSSSLTKGRSAEAERFDEALTNKYTSVENEAVI